MADNCIVYPTVAYIRTSEMGQPPHGLEGNRMRKVMAAYRRVDDL